jgi:radical SAM superfamily enzyme YgiQ (UPF0313 family)
MDILLINPPYRLKKAFLDFDVHAAFQLFPPLGLLYLGASLKKSGYSVRIIDMQAERTRIPQLFKVINETTPKIIGITCPTFLLQVVIELAQIIKAKFDIPIVVGGPHANIDPEGLLETGAIDYVMRGEAEYNLVKLADHLIQNKGDIQKINNLVFRMNGKVIHTPQGGEIEDIDAIPFPNRSLVNNNLYYWPFGKGGTCTILVTSRGCPFQCSYCAKPYKHFRKRSVDNVVEEISEIIDQYNVRNLHFFDDTFNVPPQYVIDLCNEIMARKLKIHFRIRARPGLVTDEMARRLKQAGCYAASLGIESANNDTLKFFNKNTTIEKSKVGVEIMRRHGIVVHGFFILGSPTESKEDMLRSIRFARDSGMEIASFSFLYPVPGTRLYRESIRNGWYQPPNKTNKNDYSDSINTKKPVLKHPSMSKEELKSIHRRAYWSFYRRPKTFFIQSRLLFNRHVLPRILT